MARFLTKLTVELLHDTDNEGAGSWLLHSDLCYQSDVAKTTITVPAGFVTDFASVPRIPIVFDLLGDIAQAAAVIHDRLYTTGELRRSTADAVLKEASIVSGVPKWKAWAMYLAVRLFGASHYNKS